MTDSEKEAYAWYKALEDWDEDLGFLCSPTERDCAKDVPRFASKIDIEDYIF